MYMSFMTVVMMAWITAVGMVIGPIIVRERGTVTGAFVGFLIAIIATWSYQDSEIGSRKYDQARSMIAEDCRMARIGASVLADRTITESEFWRLRDRYKKLELADARSRINGEAMRICPSTG